MSWATAVVVALLLSLGWPQLWWEQASGSPRPGVFADLLAGVAVLGLLGWRRWTVASWAVVEAASVAYAVLDYPASPVGYAGLLALAALAARAQRAALRVLGLLVGLAAVVAMDITRQPRGGAVVALANAVFVSLAWAAGTALRLWQERSISAAEAARQAHLRELEVARRELAEARVQAAVEVHDRIGHSLAAAFRQAEAAGVCDDARREVLMERVRHHIQESLGAVAKLVTTWANESPGSPSSESARNAQEHPFSTVLGEWMGTLSAAGTLVELSVTGAPEHAPARVEEAMAAVLKEAAANVSLHSAGAAVAIRVRFGPSRIILSVEDPGPSRNGCQSAGTGLDALARRVEAAGGHLRAGGTEGGGFAIEASFTVAATGTA